MCFCVFGFFRQTHKPYIRKISTRTPELLCVNKQRGFSSLPLYASRRPYADSQVQYFDSPTIYNQRSPPRPGPTGQRISSDSTLKTLKLRICIEIAQNAFLKFTRNYSTTRISCQQNAMLIYNMLTIYHIFSLFQSYRVIYIIKMMVFSQKFSGSDASSSLCEKGYARYSHFFPQLFHKSLVFLTENW